LLYGLASLAVHKEHTMKSALVTLAALFLSSLSYAQEAQEAAPREPLPAPPPVVTVEPPPTVAPVSDHSFGIHVGANIGLFEIDGQHGHFYAFGAGNLGVPILTDGRVGFGMIGAGYTFALSSPGESMWYMDVLALGTAGRVDPSVTIGGGIGIGFRYLHRSGFTFSAKVPLFGATGQVSGNYGYSGAAALGNFYLASAVSLPVVSLGYRF
jgi:hypothetical protein